MQADHPQPQSAGFTLIEMIVVVLIVSIIASAAMPLMTLHRQRMKEAELRESLRTIRSALDAYKRAWDEGRIARKEGESGYPISLMALVDGVQGVVAASPNAVDGPALTSPAVAFDLPRQTSTDAGTKGGRIYFLRRLPRDPMAPADLPAEESWGLRSYASPPDAPEAGADVFDVYSKSLGYGLDGTPYRRW